MSTEEQVNLTAHCLCRKHTFTTSVPRSSLPLPAYLCHCNSCRHLTGSLFSTDVPWPGSPSNVDLSGLSVYKFSDKLLVHFCGTCSTPLLFSHPQDPNAQHGVFTGTLTNEAQKLVNIAIHIYVGDTVDGGASMWLRHPNGDGKEVKRFKERPGDAETGTSGEELPHDWPSPSSLTGFDKKSPEDSVSIKCKCGGVHFRLHRYPHTDKTGDQLPWFVDRTTHKYKAAQCGCDSCRLSSGVDLFSWTFCDLAQISFVDGADTKTFPKNKAELKTLVDAKDPSAGTLKYYASSPDVQRYFCSSCSASVFYAVDSRPNLVDLAVGLLEASDGARAEGFLAWWFGRISHRDDTKGGWREKLVECVMKEATEWREARGYPEV
ncbi:uncharacterized protein EI97DRAFT_501872 [Westerdykella ornata]|uniref:CENP-V/GFA domain-containing protein n=1 Tax=Westerdykella ornata TaxID=318751 RepID=A0A6A6JH74_WESOR|nr:uncharacterized protein EI97DRAFT_501872 [Westerdykella ornata]KAF2275717.1 hypothetical protein EI97DRAFT_501872 [Westerdykella ornata]